MEQCFQNHTAGVHATEPRCEPRQTESKPGLVTTVSMAFNNRNSPWVPSGRWEHCGFEGPE